MRAKKLVMIALMLLAIVCASATALADDIYLPEDSVDLPEISGEFPAPEESGGEEKSSAAEISEAEISKAEHTEASRTAPFIIGGAVLVVLAVALFFIARSVKQRRADGASRPEGKS